MSIDSYSDGKFVSSNEHKIFFPFSFLLYQFIYLYCIHDNFIHCCIVTKIQFSFIYENEPPEKSIRRCFLFPFFPHCNSAYKSFKLFHSFPYEILFLTIMTSISFLSRLQTSEQMFIP